MKVLHVVSTLAPRYGGPAKVCKDMCKALAAAGEEVTIYTTDCDYPKGKLNVPSESPVAQNGYTIHYFPVQFFPYLLSMNMSNALRTHITEFDVVHIHGLYRFPQAAAGYFARKRGVPYLVRPHGSLDPFLYYRGVKRFVKRIYEFLIERHQLDRAAVIHYTSREEMLLTQPLRLQAPGIVIPIGLDIAEYDELPPYGLFRKKYDLADNEIVLHLGRINFKKGLDILIKAFAQVAHARKDVTLVIAGPDNEGYMGKVRRWIAEEGIGDLVVYTGMLFNNEKLSALRDADVFALPSYSENFGIALVEAMACGVPVVVSDKVNIWREIDKAGAGIITRCDAHEVAQALFRLLDDDQSRRIMGEAGGSLVRRNYEWSAIIPHLQTAYSEIVS